MAATPIHLSDVLITAQLAARRQRTVDKAAEAEGLAAIAGSMSYGRDAVLAAICELALKLCQAGSSGISVLAENPEEGFTWDAMAGVFAPYLHGRAPRHHSPCGITIDAGQPQLFARPDRYFEWLAAPGIPVHEGLVVPLFRAQREPYGAIWVMTHSPGAYFTQEHAALMSQLGDHVSAALRIQVQRDQNVMKKRAPDLTGRA
ncbi:GAF domain-containing protein [Massilia sp. SM-13]|uniref:GAF domain-containing protein n=1 Tax=Pseudoduganella rhizocola TaxID=3382643 RepID=UPI0038B51EFF